MGRKTEAADRTVKDIRRQTRKRYSSEEKIRIGLDGLIDQTYRLSVVWRASAELLSNNRFAQRSLYSTP